MARPSADRDQLVQNKRNIQLKPAGCGDLTQHPGFAPSLSQVRACGHRCRCCSPRGAERERGRQMRIHVGPRDDITDYAEALIAADPGAPAVAFPTPSNAASCEPLDVVWYHTDTVPANAACNIRITNVGVPQFPWVVSSSASSASSPSSSGPGFASTSTSPVATTSARSSPRRHRRQAADVQALDVPAPTPVTLELAHEQLINIRNHSMWVPQLRVPTGYYWITGTPVNAASETRYYHSAQFFVAASTDESCLFIPVLTSQSSASTITLSPSSSSPGPSSLPSQDSSRASIIAGALGGGFAVVSLLAAFFLVRFFRDRRQRRRYSNVDAAAPPKPDPRSSQAVSHIAPKGSQEKPPSPPLPPIPMSTAASVTPTPMIGAVPARKRPAPPPLVNERKLSSTPSTRTGDSTDSSFIVERTQLAEEFVVPVTPHVIADGIMSERSSAGSGVGPVAVSPPSGRVRFAPATIPSALGASPEPEPPASPTSRNRRSNALSATQVLQMSSRGS